MLLLSQGETEDKCEKEEKENKRARRSIGWIETAMMAVENLAASKFYIDILIAHV